MKVVFVFCFSRRRYNEMPYCTCIECSPLVASSLGNCETFLGESGEKKTVFFATFARLVIMNTVWSFITVTLRVQIHFFFSIHVSRKNRKCKTQQKKKHLRAIGGQSDVFENAYAFPTTHIIPNKNAAVPPNCRLNHLN